MRLADGTCTTAAAVDTYVVKHENQSKHHHSQPIDKQCQLRVCNHLCKYKYEVKNVIKSWDAIEARVFSRYNSSLGKREDDETIEPNMSLAKQNYATGMKINEHFNTNILTYLLI